MPLKMNVSLLSWKGVFVEALKPITFGSCLWLDVRPGGAALVVLVRCQLWPRSVLVMRQA
jgi:hypothetical protein